MISTLLLTFETGFCQRPILVMGNTSAGICHDSAAFEFTCCGVSAVAIWQTKNAPMRDVLTAFQSKEFIKNFLNYGVNLGAVTGVTVLGAPLSFGFGSLLAGLGAVAFGAVLLGSDVSVLVLELLPATLGFLFESDLLINAPIGSSAF